MAAAVLQVPPPSQIREELQAVVLRDLLGPAGGPEEEVDENRIIDRYLVGLLAPKRQVVSIGEFDELAVGGDESSEDGTTDVGAPQATTMFPSSFGLTFSVDGGTDAIQVAARWGFYDRLPSERLTTPRGEPKRVWKRRQIDEVSGLIPLTPGPIRWTPAAEFPDVMVQGVVRRQGSEWIATVFLVNGQEEPRLLRDKAWLFQPELVITAPGGAAAFRKRIQLHDPARVDVEDRAMAMIYRKQVEFAVGHGVAVHADLEPGSTDRAVRVSTRTVPVAEVPRVAAPTPEEVPELAGLVRDMKVLAET